MIVVGVDIGGTFTDLMLYDTASEAVHVHKVRSTPAEPERAMVEGLVELCAQAGVDPRDVGASTTGRPSPRTPCSRSRARRRG